MNGERLLLLPGHKVSAREKAQNRLQISGKVKKEAHSCTRFFPSDRPRQPSTLNNYFFLLSLDPSFTTTTPTTATGCISVSGVRLSPTPRAGPVSLRLPASLGGLTLLSADRVVASEKLWRILLLSRFDVAVHGCELDAGVDEGTLVPHFGRLLLWSGLTSMREEEGGEEGEDDFEAELLRRTRARTRTRSGGGGGGGGAKKRRSGSSPPASVNGDSDSSSESDSERREGVSSFVAEEAPAVAAAAAAATAATAATAPASSSSPSSSSSSTPTLKKQASISFPPPISVAFTARLRCGPATVHIGRGKLRILEAAAEVLIGKKKKEEEEEEGGEKKEGERDEGENAAAAIDGVISVVFAAGAAALRREALALALCESSSSSSLRWADECSALPREPGASDGNPSGNGGSDGRRRTKSGGGRGTGRQRIVRCRPLLPFALRLEARHCGVQASGWWTTTGFLLREPASAAFDLTPALVGGVLSRINPLLAGAVRLREDDAVRVSLWPLSEDGGAGGVGAGAGGGGGGHLPASSGRIAMKPLRLQMEPTALVAGSLRLVSGYNRAARALGGGTKTKKKENAAPSSSSSSSSSSASAAAASSIISLSRRSAPAAASSPLSAFASFGKLTGRSGGGRRSSSGGGGKNSPQKQPRLSPKKEATLEAWTSSLSATLYGGGRNSKGFWVDSGRLDMLISKSGFAASGAKVGLSSSFSRVFFSSSAEKRERNGMKGKKTQHFSPSPSKLPLQTTANRPPVPRTSLPGAQPPCFPRRAPPYGPEKRRGSLGRGRGKERRRGRRGNRRRGGRGGRRRRGALPEAPTTARALPLPPRRSTTEKKPQGGERRRPAPATAAAAATATAAATPRPRGSA